MNCQQVDKCLYDYCDHILTPEQQILFEQHLSSCHSCRQLVDQALLETSILREEWDNPPLPADFTSRVMERIAAKPIPQAGVITQDAVNVKRPWLRWFMSVTAAAAVLLMVLYAPGMIKNEKIINVADQEKFASEPAGDKVKVNSPAINNEDVLMGGKEMATNSNKIYPNQANQEESDASVANRPSPAITFTNKPILYGAEDSTVSKNVITNSVDQNKDEIMVATSVFPVQPANLPASYTMVDKIDGTGFCTYIFGTGIKNDSLTINIAQAPLHRSGQSSYSRSYVRPASTADINLKAITTPVEPAGDESETEKIAVEEMEKVEILTKEGIKTDTTTTESSHTISYEVVHNNQTYLLTITADLPPEELMALSQSLQLQTSTP